MSGHEGPGTGPAEGHPIAISARRVVLGLLLIVAVATLVLIGIRYLFL